MAIKETAGRYMVTTARVLEIGMDGFERATIRGLGRLI